MTLTQVKAAARRQKGAACPPSSPSSADDADDRDSGADGQGDLVPEAFREMVDGLVAVKLRKTPDENEKVFLASFLKQAHSLKSARAITEGFIEPVLAALGRAQPRGRSAGEAGRDAVAMAPAGLLRYVRSRLP